MKILVMVGTTPFDRLIKTVDNQLSHSYDVISQISEGEYEPKAHEYFRFSDNINEYIDDAELIISHGGAGSIYGVLERGKKLLIVPNLDRVDHHQLDICQYMKENDHADACTDLEKLAESVERAIKMHFLPYKPVPFTGIPEIRAYLGL